MAFQPASLRWLALPALASLSLCLWPSTPPGQVKAETGETIYQQRCAGCHGADGSGSTSIGRVFKLRDLRSEGVQKMTDVQLSEIIARGRGRMPAFENSLGRDRIHAVVAYLRGLAKKK